MHRDIRQIFLFLTVGALSTALNYLVFWVFLEHFHRGYLFAQWTGYFAGVFLGYLLNAHYTFQMTGDLTFKHPVSYAGVYSLSLLLSSLTLYALVEYFRIMPKISNVIAIAQSTATNYLGCRFFVFRKKGLHAPLP